MFPVRLCFGEVGAASLPSGEGPPGKGSISSFRLQPTGSELRCFPTSDWDFKKTGLYSTIDWNSLKQLFFSSPFCHQEP